MDHRVSASREDDLQRSHFARVGDMEDWWEALLSYFQGELCLPCAAGAPPPVSALIRATNANNLVPLKVPRFDRLIHVASLNRLVELVSYRRMAADASSQLTRLVGRGLPVRPFGAPDPSWLDAPVRELALGLERRGEDAVRAAAGIFADALGETEPFWWACFADEVKTLLHSDDAAGLLLGSRPWSSSLWGMASLSGIIPWTRLLQFTDPRWLRRAVRLTIYSFAAQLPDRSYNAS